MRMYGVWFECEQRTAHKMRTNTVTLAHLLGKKETEIIGSAL